MNKNLEQFGISDDLYLLSKETEKELQDKFKELDSLCEYNSLKVLNAFQKHSVTEAHFASTTGYGYGDIGRDTIEEIFAEVLGAESALVRNQFISGSHALNVALFAFLRPGDTMLSITGKPYDTLDEVIGIVDNPSSLKSFGIKYEQIDLINNEFDIEAIKNILSKEKVKLIEIQRSKGYSQRKSLSIEKLSKVIKLIKELSPKSIVMVDNCYCEFVSTKEPTEVGADIVVGSLIKNLGGGIASNGAYIVGRKDLCNLAGERLNLPGEGKDVGPSLGANKDILKGLYFAPSVVGSALKTAILTSYLLEKKGYDVEPKYYDDRVDIVQCITFHNENDMVKYVQSIQSMCAIDSNVFPEKSDIPGYSNKIIMASGSFTQGSSIELSCDGPIKPPFTVYQQGSLTYEYGKIAIINAISKLD